MLAFLPSPAYALLMCFPVSEASEKHRAEEAETITKAGQTVDASIWHTKQTVGNACGTVGLLHAVINNAPFVCAVVPLLTLVQSPRHPCA
jgi:ubiquitin carboxyl-terminal hydrolase L3